MAETVAAFIYFGGVAALAAWITFLGLLGRWSKDDWPVFALIVPWVWPLFLIVIPGAAIVDNIWEPWRWHGKSPRWNPKDWTW